MKPSLVWEDKHLLALCKPFGMPSQSDTSGDLSILDWAKELCAEELHLLHRLDRPTGGLILLSKSREGAAHLSRQFSSREVKKVYLGVTAGSATANQMTLNHHIAKLPGKNFVRAYDKAVRNSKPAELSFVVKGSDKGLTLLEVFPRTGRRHQIRAQLRTVKLPLVGDQKYGKGKPLPYPGIALWAHALSFRDLHGSKVELKVSPPDDYPWSGFLPLLAKETR